MGLPKTAKQISGSKDYVDMDGKVYFYDKHKKDYMQKSQHPCQGYMYTSIYMIKEHKCISKRVHKLVAKAFIPNPENLPVVAHKNNIKSDNRIENLYWMSYQENTQKGVNDGLVTIDKGMYDSQSMPVIMYDTFTNEIIGEYESISEAVKKTGLNKTTICRQAKYHRPVRKPYYFRYKDDETAVSNQIVGQFDYETDRLIGTYYNIGSASKLTNICEKTINQQCHNGKPKHKFSDTYFAFLNSKM